MKPRIRFTQLHDGSHRIYDPLVGPMDLVTDGEYMYWIKPYEPMFPTPKPIDWNAGEHIETFEERLNRMFPRLGWFYPDNTRA